MNKNRLESFSDGVLAIIITIMVLNIQVPHGSSWTDLKPLLPVFISYVTSFTFIGIYWGNHHHLLHSLKQISSGIMWANLNLLFWLSLIPVATGWMGENHFAPNTVMAYGILLLMNGIAFTILRKRVEHHTHDLLALKTAFYIMTLKGYISMIGYVISIPLAYVTPILSGVIFFAIAFLWLIPDKNIEKALNESK